MLYNSQQSSRKALLYPQDVSLGNFCYISLARNEKPLLNFQTVNHFKRAVTNSDKTGREEMSDRDATSSDKTDIVRILQCKLLS
jgi:hypothetical protein